MVDYPHTRRAGSAGVATLSQQSLRSARFWSWRAKGQPVYKNHSVCSGVGFAGGIYGKSVGGSCAPSVSEAAEALKSVAQK